MLHPKSTQQRTLRAASIQKRPSFWGEEAGFGLYLIAVAEVAAAGAVGALGVLGFPIDLAPFDLLAGHMATETGLDLGSCRVGIRVVQRDVQDVLVQFCAGSLLAVAPAGLQRMAPRTARPPPQINPLKKVLNEPRSKN